MLDLQRALRLGQPNRALAHCFAHVQYAFAACFVDEASAAFNCRLHLRSNRPLRSILYFLQLSMQRRDLQNSCRLCCTRNVVRTECADIASLLGSFHIRVSALSLAGRRCVARAAGDHPPGGIGIVVCRLRRHRQDIVDNDRWHDWNVRLRAPASDNVASVPRVFVDDVCPLQPRCLGIKFLTAHLELGDAFHRALRSNLRSLHIGSKAFTRQGFLRAARGWRVELADKTHCELALDGLRRELCHRFLA